MTLKQAIATLERVQQQANSKSESSIVARLLAIFYDLADRDWTKDQQLTIQKELDGLQTDKEGTSRKKHFQKFYNRFTNTLRKEFNLVTPNYYTTLTMVFGMTFGSGIGLALGTAIKGGPGTAIGMSLGTGVGMVIGIAIGKAKDNEAIKEGRVIGGVNE